MTRVTVTTPDGETTVLHLAIGDTAIIDATGLSARTLVGRAAWVWRVKRLKAQNDRMGRLLADADALLAEHGIERAF